MSDEDRWPPGVTKEDLIALGMYVPKAEDLSGDDLLRAILKELRALKVMLKPKPKPVLYVSRGSW